MTNMDETDRFKQFEQKNKPKLDSDWICGRFDGKGFSKLTAAYTRPFDKQIWKAMDSAAQLMFKVMTPNLIHMVSDEISLIWNVDRNGGQQMPWGGDVQKICSIGAAAATAGFISELPQETLALFDGRVFEVPSKEEAVGYLKNRFMSGKRNSISSLAQTLYSQKTLHRVGSGKMLEMIKQDFPLKAWDNFPEEFKRGTIYYRENYQANTIHGMVERHRIVSLPVMEWTKSVLGKSDRSI